MRRRRLLSCARSYRIAGCPKHGDGGGDLVDGHPSLLPSKATNSLADGLVWSTWRADFSGRLSGETGRPAAARERDLEAASPTHAQSRGDPAASIAALPARSLASHKATTSSIPLRNLASRGTTWPRRVLPLRRMPAAEAFFGETGSRACALSYSACLEGYSWSRQAL
ncbi:hypothetical protein MRX96_030701 [Rhipicephalus microplus]